MKKTIFLILALVLTANVFAQSFDKSNLRAGAGLVYASEISNLGINLNGVYAFSDEWEGSLGFTHIFKKDYVTFNILDLDGHYIFFSDEESSLNVYGLAGLGLTFSKVKFPAMDLGIFGTTSSETVSSTDAGLNLGVGANYKISEELNLAPEIRYTIMSGSYLRVGVTLQYMF